MDELIINLIRIPEKSKIRSVLGLTYLFFGLTIIILILLIEGRLSVLMSLICIFLVLDGIIFYIDGLGISISGLFGEAYIWIDNSEIRVKKSIFSKESILFRDHIDRIVISVICIRFKLKDGTGKKLDYSNLDYTNIQKIKKTIRTIMAEKGITEA
ncbi:MAG TPA: hypothetical protein VJ963_14955 [Bacteroidales bacterium]|nr:hypothetical protein [Bacteroidales bacterium]